MRVVFATARSSPGVTAAMLACASVWTGRVLLVEGSEDGGVLAARFGLPLEPGLTTLAAASRHSVDGGAELVAAHAQPLPGTERIGALVGPVSLEPAQALLRTAGGRIATLLTSVRDVDVLVDVGRLSAASLAAPLLEAADRFVLVARPRVEELTALAYRLPLLADLGPPPQLVLVGERPYGAREVGDTLGVPVLGVLAADAPAAEVLAASGAGGRQLVRSRLLRSAVAVVDELHGGGSDSAAETIDVRARSAANGAPVPAKRRRVSTGRS